MSNNVFKGIILFVALSVSLGVLVVGILSLRSYFTKAAVGSNSEPKNVRTANITDQSAVILWESEIENQGLIRYATDPSAFNLGNASALLFIAESKPTKNHEVKLTSLKPNTTYYYQIELAVDKDKNIYDQGGLVKDNKNLPFTFTTQKSTQNSSEIPSLDPEIFRQKFGSQDPLYDLNKDGIVNSSDYLIYLSRSSTATP